MYADMVVDSADRLLIDVFSQFDESNGRVSIGRRLFHTSLAMIEFSQTNAITTGANIRWKTTV